METYRKKLKLQNLLYIAGLLPLGAVMVLSMLSILSPAAVDERFAGFWNGFMGGASAATAVLFILGLILNLRALRSGAALRKQFIKETDERNVAVHEKGKALGSSIFIVLMLPATVICGYFSAVVFFTALAFETALCVCIGLSKLYYAKKL